MLRNNDIILKTNQTCITFYISQNKAFSALTLLVWQQEEHSVDKKSCSNKSRS